MITIDLRKEDSLFFKKFSYPDGQQNVVINIYEKHYQIVSSFNNFQHLELIICAVTAIRNLNNRANIILYIPYLLGARSDRQFQNGGTKYLKDVIAPILNSLHLEEIICYDVHNEVLADACINNLTCLTNYTFVESILKTRTNYCICSPDAGSEKKIYELCKYLKFTGDLIKCQKIRELSTGKIIETKVDTTIVDLQNKDVYIIDDICDGGRTFIEIAKRLKLLNCGNLYLVVSHGIFHNGFSELKEYFKNVYTTNSFYSDEKHIKILEQFSGIKDYVKIINI